MSTHYRRDIIEAFQAQHPTSFGVVAVAPGSPGLVGMATAFIDEVTIDGRIVPCAHLENLKVRHDMRRQGLGTRLAEWRIEEARRRFGGDGVIATIIDSTNTASLATAARWSSQVLGPARIVIARTASRMRPMRGVRFRALADDEVGTVLDAIGTFYQDHDLVPRLTPEGFAAAFGPTRFGETIRHYRVAVADDGTLLAGVAVTERFKLMVDHIDSDAAAAGRHRTDQPASCRPIGSSARSSSVSAGTRSDGSTRCAASGMRSASSGTAGRPTSSPSSTRADRSSRRSMSGAPSRHGSSSWPPSTARSRSIRRDRCTCGAEPKSRGPRGRRGPRASVDRVTWAAAAPCS